MIGMVFWRRSYDRETPFAKGIYDSARDTLKEMELPGPGDPIPKWVGEVEGFRLDAMIASGGMITRGR
jgi:hypothetical protein